MMMNLKKSVLMIGILAAANVSFTGCKSPESNESKNSSSQETVDTEEAERAAINGDGIMANYLSSDVPNKNLDALIDFGKSLQSSNMRFMNMVGIHISLTAGLAKMTNQTPDELLQEIRKRQAVRG